MKITGIILIVAGILALAYQGFTYTTKQKDLQIGDLQVQHDQQNYVYLPPVIGIGAIVVGGVLVAVGARRSIL